MKIGIVTLQDHWIRINYGTLLQTYALQEVLRREGHEPFLIRRDITPFKKDFKWAYRRMLHVMRSPLSYLRDKVWRHKVASYQAQGTASFDEFVERYITRTPKMYKEEELMSTPPEADAYICGSDQVWGTIADSHFIAFAPLDKRIYYAPSCVWNENNKPLCRAISKHLANADALSVREEKGKELIYKLTGREAEVVADPVLLLEAEDYKRLAGMVAPVPSAPYLLLYALNLPTGEDIRIDEVLEYCRKKGLELKIVAGQGAQDVLPAQYFIRPSVEEFISLILHAEAFVTNSFHGSIIAYLFRKPLTTISQTGATSLQNSRFSTLFPRLGIQPHMLEQGTPLEEVLQRPYPETDEALIAWKKSSMQFLRNNLQRILNQNEK